MAATGNETSKAYVFYLKCVIILETILSAVLKPAQGRRWNQAEATNPLCGTSTVTILHFKYFGSVLSVCKLASSIML